MSGIAPATKRSVEFPSAELPAGANKATAPSNDPTGVTVVTATAAATASTTMTTTLDGQLANGDTTTAVVGVSNCNGDNGCAPTVSNEHTSPMIQRQTRSLNLPSHASVNGTSDGYGPPSLGYRLQQRMGRLTNGHANSRSTGAEPERLARQDAIHWTRKEESLRKSPLGRTDDALLSYDDGSDGEFENELFSSASASAAAAMAAEAAAAASAQRNHNSRLPMGVAPRQYSLAVHSLAPSANDGGASAGGGSCALGAARMTRGVTCEEFDFPVAPPSPQPPSPQTPTRIAPTVSAPPYINKLPATPEERNTNGQSPTVSPSVARRASRNATNPQLPHPIDANVRHQPVVAVTLNGCLRNGSGGSFNPLPSCVSPSVNGRLDADYGSGVLHVDHKSRSLTNLENAAISRRVCISPASIAPDTNEDTVDAGQQWRHASSSASNLRQLNRQNLRLAEGNYASATGPATDTVIHATSTVVPQNCMSQPSASHLATVLREMAASASSIVLTNENAVSSTTSTVRSPRCESPIRIFPRQHHIVAERDSDVRLQQSLSTPCSSGDGESARSTAGHSMLANGGVSTGGTTGGSSRKDSEYRRFRSEGSATNSALVGGTAGGGHGDMDGMPIDDLSPIADRSSPPHRMNLFQDAAGGVNGGGTLAKHSQTEQVLMMHILKTKLQKYQGFIDEAFKLIHVGTDEQIFEGCTIVTRVMTKAWIYPKISHDLAYALCDYLRDQYYMREQKETYLEILINLFIKQTSSDSVRLCCGRVLEECMSSNNRDYVVSRNYLKRVVQTAEKLNKNPEQQRISLSIMESLFKHSAETTSKLVEGDILDHILLTCKRASETPVTLRHAALALANLSLYSTSEAKKKIIQKKLPDWLFLLASQQDEVTRYYACLAICILASSSSNSKEMEGAVTKSGTLALVEPFLVSHQPTQFARDDYKHSQGRPKEWLVRLLPMLRSKCREAKSMAAFHFTMEASTKKDQQKLQVLQEIGAIEALKEVASSPDEVAAKFASEALTIIGEEVPYKLSQQVPCWSISDVKYWVEKIGFDSFGEMFTKNMVDGDMLLLLTEKELEEDLQMSSGLLRKRFMRELESLKIAADYSSVDESQLDQFLMSLSPELSVYTYQMLFTGLNRNLLPQLTNEMMKTVCGIQNPIHRLKLRQALQDSKHIDDIEVAILSKQIDVFISYRRSTGNQLASLIKVLLQLRGYKVFIDVDKLYAGKFDSHLLKNIQAAKHFILVLTPHSLDRLLNDYNCEDWIHKELRCAFEHQKNVIPIFDQQFEFPSKESQLPDDIRQITRFNGVRWVHDYQEACVDKVERFIKGELNRMPSLGPNQLSVRPSNQPTSRKAAYKLVNTTGSPPTGIASGAVTAGVPSSMNGGGGGRTSGALPSVGSGGSLASTGGMNGTAGSTTSSNASSTAAVSARNRLAVAGGFDSNSRALSMEKQRRKLFSSSVSTVYSDK